VAIVVKGRLVAAGSLDELTAFEAKGWELVVTGLADAVLDRMRVSISGATQLGDGRYALMLPPSAAPEPLIAALSAAGAHIVSLTALRATLEDFFMEQVRAASRDRSKATLAS
jgi:hypothetical protein